MEGIGVVEKICKNKVRWRTADASIKQSQSNLNMDSAAEEDLEKLQQQIEQSKSDLELAENIIKSVQDENKAMTESDVYRQLAYLVPNDIITADTVVCYALNNETIVNMTKQHQSKIGPVYDVKISNPASQVKFEVLNMTSYSIIQDQSPSLEQLFSEWQP